jgi:hypothetical protein
MVRKRDSDRPQEPLLGGRFQSQVSFVMSNSYHSSTALPEAHEGNDILAASFHPGSDTARLFSRVNDSQDNQVGWNQ